MNIIIASDEKTPLTDFVVKYMQEQGHRVTLYGDLIDEKEKWHWAEIGLKAGKQVIKDKAEMGIFFCWSGTGVCMAANKVEGIRAALCWDTETARLARKWDDANVLCLNLRSTSETEAKEIIDTWLSTPFDEETLDQVKYLKTF